MRIRPLWIGMAMLSFVLGACQQIDPLSVQDNPAGDRVVEHVLIGPEGSESQGICVLASQTDPCSEETADVLVADFANVDDVQVEWMDNRNVRVTVASGKIVRADPWSRDGKTSIALVRSGPPPLGG